MKKIGLVYATKADKTSWVAEKIKKAWADELEVVSVETAGKKELQGFDALLIGVATWFDGELPTSWDEWVPELRTLHLKGKKVALFGLGDQVKYPDNFADGVGLLAELLESVGATLVGFTSIDGYSFAHSRALRNDKWCGLILDMENQPDLSVPRIEEWCKQVKGEL